MLVDCEVSDRARRAAGLGNIFDAWFQQVSSAQELVYAICSSEDKNKAGMFAMLVWTLWNNRNNKVWNDASKTGRNIGFKARQLWEEWNAVKKLQHGGTTIGSASAAFEMAKSHARFVQMQCRCRSEHMQLKNSRY
jgi:hypothetical protein